MNTVLKTNGHKRSMEPARGDSNDNSDLAPLLNGDSEQTTFLLGFDWGTNKSCLQGAFSGAADTSLNEVIPTVVGYTREGIVPDILPENKTMFFGEEALKYRLHLNLIAPMIDGVLKDTTAARHFATHLRSLIDVPNNAEIRAVIGVPANADRSARESMRQAVTGIFEKVILVPEPFLAAVGFREDAQLGEVDYVDPVRNSLFIDIGGGTTDLCLVQGYYPGAEDQVSLAFAGDKIDAFFQENLRKTYPDCEISTHKIREIKEKHSFVGAPAGPIEVTVISGGKPKKIEISQQLGAACQQLADKIFEACKTLIAQACSDSVSEMLKNIVLTGGGSRIRNLGPVLQQMLENEGYDSPKVRVASENYKEYVARGALKVARQARETQWQQVLR